MDEEHAIASLSSISNQTRLRVLKALVAAGSTGMTAGDIAAKVGATPSRASFHLANMSETGLITSERAARQVIYRIDFDAVGELVRYLVDDCCRNDARVVACCMPRSGKHAVCLRPDS